MFVLLMRKEVKNMFPQWVNEKLDRDLMLSNDLDSLLSCTLLNQLFDYKINAYYKFDDGVGLIDTNNPKKLIGVDICLTGESLCWDNHVSKLNKDSYVNPNSANLNAIFGIHATTKYSYFKKMAFSTVLQIWSYYNIPLPKTDKGKMLLLSIDSSYLGFYDHRFKDTWINYMKILQFDELIEFCQNHTKQDFKKFKENYTESIYLSDGYVQYDQQSRQFVEDCLGFNLYIPDGQFNKVFDVKAHRKPIHMVHDISRDKNIVSYAIINSKEVKYSELIEN